MDRHKQAALMAQDPKLWRGVQKGGLELYLPLWHPSMQGSPIISKDLNAHSCTVTGATWGATGRTFAGAGKIDCGNICNFTGEPITIITWVKSDLSGTMDISSNCNDETHNGYFLRIVNDGRIGFRTLQNGPLQTQTSYSAVGSVIANTWLMIAVVRDGASVKFYKNDEGQLAYQTEETHINPIASSNSLLLGVNNSGARAFTGIIGEYSHWTNKAFSLYEINNFYHKTKWRYQ